MILMGLDFNASHMFVSVTALRLMGKSFQGEKAYEENCFDGNFLVLYFSWKKIKLLYVFFRVLFEKAYWFSLRKTLRRCVW
jgi:hypothetical protein